MLPPYNDFLYLQFGVDDWLRAHPVLLALLASISSFAIGSYGKSKGRGAASMAFRVMGLLILVSFAADAIRSRMFIATTVLLLAFAIEMWLMKRRSRSEGPS